MWIFDFHQAVSSFFHYEVTRISRVYKHAATNDNSLDLDPFNRKLALVGIIPIKFSSLSAPTKIEELTAGSDEKTQRSPAGNRTQGLAHALTTELRSHNGNCVWIFDFHQAVSSFFHYEVTRIARVYKHAATNDNSLDLDPFNRKLALVGIIPIKVSSLSAPTKIGMIPTRASLRFIRTSCFVTLWPIAICNVGG